MYTCNCLTDSQVKDVIVSKVHVMDDLACRLDQPICHEKREVPTATQYWVHLAEEFKVPIKVVKKCKQNSVSSPSRNMLEFQEACDPDFTVKSLKDGLQVIPRYDLVVKLEQCCLPGEFPAIPIIST